MVQCNTIVFPGNVKLHVFLKGVCLAGVSILLENKLLGLGDAGMSGSDVVVELGNDFALKGVGSGDIDPSVIVNESVDLLHSSVMVDQSENILVPCQYVVGCFY